jgi:radical SAM protein with 4Fe4S-binding SPASM domain
MPLQAQIRLGPRCVGDVAIRVEPDGSVIPPRGRYRTAGNILQDDWSAIWHHEAFRAYRERVEAPSRCDICPDLLICVAGCPSDPRSWAVNVAI